MNKQELIHELKAQMMRPVSDWDSGWNHGILFAMSAIRNCLPEVRRDYSSVFAAWKEAI